LAGAQLAREELAVAGKALEEALVEGIDVPAVSPGAF